MNIVNSWKEIANYLGRGVRTAQRWEHDLGMPVHRPKGKERGAVLAFPEELDKWLQQTPVRSAEMVGNPQPERRKPTPAVSARTHPAARESTVKAAGRQQPIPASRCEG